MKLKRFCAGLAALCMICAVVPMLPASAEDTIIVQVYEGIDYVKYEDHIEIFGASKDNTELIIPAEIDGLPVTSIRIQAFIDANITSVTIPESITDIGQEAFAYCTALTDVTISDGVKSIGIQAFSDCTNLVSVTIPDSVEEIGALRFYNCSSLKSITLPDKITEIKPVYLMAVLLLFLS